MQLVLEAVGFSIGLAITILWVRNVALPLVYGVPRALAASLRGLDAWAVATRHVVHAGAWTAGLIGTSTLVAWLTPLAVGTVVHCEGFGAGQWAGIALCLALCSLPEPRRRIGGQFQLARDHG